MDYISISRLRLGQIINEISGNYESTLKLKLKSFPAKQNDGDLNTETEAEKSSLASGCFQMLACLLCSRIVDEHFIATANGKQHENMNWKFHAPFKLSLIETDYMCTVCPNFSSNRTNDFGQPCISKLSGMLLLFQCSLNSSNSVHVFLLKYSSCAVHVNWFLLHLALHAIVLVIQWTNINCIVFMKSI